MALQTQKIIDLSSMPEEPSVDDTGKGISILATVDANATGIGAAMHCAADGHWEEADASADTTAPCTGLALSSGTGASKEILQQGQVRNDGWTWVTGPGEKGLIYLSITTGALTQTAPTGDGEIVQIVGHAITDDVMMFNPQLQWIELGDGPGDLHADGSVPLTANWDVLDNDIRAQNLTADDLTAGRAVFTGADGLLSVDDAFVWDNSAKTLTTKGVVNDIVTTKTAIATLTVAEAGTVLVSCAATPYTITLPTAVGNAGLRYHFTKTDDNYFLITLDGDGAETFNYENATGVPVATYPRLNTYCAEVTVVSDGANWQVIDESLGQVPKCFVRLTNAQNNLTNNVSTLVNLSTEIYDIGGNFDTGTHLFTCPVPGSYNIISNMAFSSIVADARYFVQQYKNAVNISSVAFHASFTGSIYGSNNTEISCAISDTISTYVKSVSGDDTVDIAVNATPEFSYMQVRLISKD